MLIRDLINKLEEIDEAHTDAGLNEMIGPASIEIDVFKRCVDDFHKFYYAGFDHEIRVELSSDGVYHILSLFHKDT